MKINLEESILSLLKKQELDEADFTTVGGPDPATPLTDKLDYTKDIKMATVPQATKIANVGEIGSDDPEENDDITVVNDDSDDDDDSDEEDLDESFAALLSRLAEEDESDSDDDNDDDESEDKPKKSGVKETLPDVDSMLDSPEDLVTKAPGVKVAESEEKDPKEILPDVDSMLDEPEDLVTPAKGAKTPDVKVDEDLAAIFSGTNLSESAQEKIKTIFQAAVANRVNEETKKVTSAASSALKEEYKKVIQVSTDKLREAFEIVQVRAKQKEAKLEEQVNNYMDYVVEKWLEENRIGVERGIRAEIAENFIQGLKKLFIENYIEVPESKVDVVETLGKKLTSLEVKNSELVEEAVKNRATILSYRKNEVLESVSNDLADTQKEKLRTLAESVPFTTKKEFKEKVSMIKESYFTKKSAPKRDLALTEQLTVTNTDVDPEMAAYVDTLSKFTQN